MNKELQALEKIAHEILTYHKIKKSQVANEYTK